MKFNPVLRRHVGKAVALVAAGLIGGLGATAANASFDDVPDEGNYAEHITNLQEAGIATGYADGSFRPAADMNRRQTAAWLDRSAGRVGVADMLEADESITLDAGHLTDTVNTVEMTSPAAGDGHGWVTLQGGVGGVAVSGGENCPCTVLLYIRNSSDQVVGRGIMTIFDPQGSLAFSTAGAIAVTPLAAGETETYRLDVELLDTDVSIVMAGSLFGTYAPLADGDTEGTIFESGGQDPVESVVPEIPFTGAN